MKKYDRRRTAQGVRNDGEKVNAFQGLVAMVKDWVGVRV